jgi:hypothetical protein
VAAIGHLLRIFIPAAVPGDECDDPQQFAWIVIITVACSTVVWLIAMAAPEKRRS